MADHRPIDFADLAAALLKNADTLVPKWLKDGRRIGHEWVCGSLGGGEGRSCSINLVSGKWADFSSDDAGGDLISLYAAIQRLNQGQAARQLMRELGWQRDDEQAPAQAPRAVEPEPRKSMWRPIVPVPASAPAPTFKHFHYAAEDLAATWEYRFDGQLYGHVARYQGQRGKTILPWTWCVDESDDRGTRRWHNKQWEAPRPLYVPAGRFSEPPLPIVLVEGEKCALAGHELLGAEFDFLTWPGGALAWKLADWSWIAGRTVYLWADCDAKRKRLTRPEREDNIDPTSKPLLPGDAQPGVRAMREIGAHLATEHRCIVLWCHVPQPGAVSDGWDLADAVAQGWDAERVRSFINGAKPLQLERVEGKSTPSMADAAKGVEASSEPELRTWPDCLLKRRDQILAVRDNLVTALNGVPSEGVPGIPEAQGLIAYNEFTNNVDKRRATPWGTKAGEWQEADELLMGAWLVRSHGLPSMPRATLEEAVVMVGHMNAYHPVRQIVEARRGTWDGTQRLNIWLARCCMEEDEWDHTDPLHRYLARVGTWLLMAMSARVLPTVKDRTQILRGPGTKFDYMVIFEGAQGVGKSTLVSLLGQGHSADTGLMLDNKDSYQNLQGVWIYEWAELDALNRAEVSKVKSFTSSTEDRFRASFDRRAKDYPRQVVFIGTTNEDHYLSDPTGNRRFWPVKVTRQIDLEWLKANLDQMMAEALHYLDAGHRFWPTPTEQRELFEQQQQRRTVESSIEAGIRTYLYDDDQHVPHGRDNGTLRTSIAMTELLERVGYAPDKQTDVVVKKAGAIMKRLGWVQKRDNSKPNRPRLYVRPARETDPNYPRTPGQASASATSHGSAPAGWAPSDDDEYPDGIPF